jgi:hypothetical protein
MTKRHKPANPPATTLPATLFEAEAVDTIVGWYDRVSDLMTSEEGRLRLRASLLEKLQAGTISRMGVIAAADAGDQDAVEVLRILEIEYMGHWGKSEPPPPDLIAYFQRASLRTTGGPSGRNTGNYWKRDLGIAIIVQMTMGRWHVPRIIKRGRVSKNPERLSACYLVSVALGRRGINISERGVEDITLDQVQARLAERLSGFLSPV